MAERRGQISVLRNGGNLDDRHGRNLEETSASDRQAHLIDGIGDMREDVEEQLGWQTSQRRGDQGLCD